MSDSAASQDQDTNNRAVGEKRVYVKPAVDDGIEMPSAGAVPNPAFSVGTD